MLVLHFALFITIPFPIFFVSVPCSQLDVQVPTAEPGALAELKRDALRVGRWHLDVGHVDEAMKIKL